MGRSERLLELLIVLQTRPRFTAGELAAELAVSRRTMLRDLHALSAMGVPLSSTPGPGGGYALVPGRRLLPLGLSPDEALGVLLSYEAFLEYAQSPFAAQSLSAVTKLRAALPPDVVAELDRVRRHVAVLERPRSYDAPCLGDVLRAALDGAHLRVRYDGRSGASERVIYPYGLYASAGYWYCACHDYKRGIPLGLRADRIRDVERISGLERPAHIPLATWFDAVERLGDDALSLRARVTARGMKSWDLEGLFGPIRPDGAGGGVIDTAIPATEVEWFASRLLPAGADVVVESPPELVGALRRRALEVAGLYAGVPGNDDDATRPDQHSSKSAAARAPSRKRSE